jgi:SAM-dependent methyltransferase
VGRAATVGRLAARLADRVVAEVRPRVGTRLRRLATHRLRTRLQRRRLARTAGLTAEERPMVQAVDPAIAPRDTMYVGDGEHYFSVGLSALRCVESAHAEVGAAPPRRMLDMPCGHGRVLRFLVRRFPDATAVACDLDPDAVAFCAQQFGALAVHSSEDLADVNLPGPFELIWCGSLVTHLDAGANAKLLGLFRRSLAPGGLAVVTTHGELVAERLRAGETYQLDPSAARAVVDGYEATGFGYADYPWSQGYGVSVSSREWIAAAAAEAGLRVSQFAEHAWDDHQDVVALTRVEPDSGR